nr:glycosyltransferase family 2 protein [Variovorax sp. dw_308]
MPDVSPVVAFTSPRVAVLMSTYQGARYITEQLQSVLAQLPAQGTVIVRDDGSSDETVAKIAALADLRVNVVQGPNLGFGQSFLTLLARAPVDVDMVMFADQDDVWLPGKIERAWQQLSALGDVPALYGSAQMLADQDLRPLKTSWRPPRGPSFTNALTENIIVGCTTAINRPAVKILQRAGIPPGLRFHDWWIYLVVSALGVVTYDEEATLLYRQHDANVIGRHPGRVAGFRRAWKVIIRNDWLGSLFRQIHAFLGNYGDLLSPEDKMRVARYFYKQQKQTTPRWSLIFSLVRWRQLLKDELILRCMLALYKLGLLRGPG